MIGGAARNSSPGWPRVKGLFVDERPAPPVAVHREE